MFHDELQATKRKAAEQLAKNRKQYENRLATEKSVAQRAAAALIQLEAVQATAERDNVGLKKNKTAISL